MWTVTFLKAAHGPHIISSYDLCGLKVNMDITQPIQNSSCRGRYIGLVVRKIPLIYHISLAQKKTSVMSAQPAEITRDSCAKKTSVRGRKKKMRGGLFVSRRFRVLTLMLRRGVGGLQISRVRHFFAAHARTFFLRRNHA
jgi:hypothetical protein